MRRVVVACLATVALVLAGLVSISLPGAQAAKDPQRKAAEQPNIIVILTDDQPKQMLGAMPTVRKLAQHGVTYNNAVVPNSLCCPSRASLLTGRYSAETGVWSNQGDDGGWPQFTANGNDKQSIAVELKRLGYQTGFFGKYLNDFKPPPGAGAPPGWDSWRSMNVRSRTKELTSYEDFNVYTNDDQPREELRAEWEVGYSTTYFGEATEAFIRAASPEEPLFTIFAPRAPHMPATPEPQYENTAPDGTALTKDPAFDEDDVSDKPPWIQAQGKGEIPGSWRWGSPAEVWQNQWETMRSVDDQVDSILTALKETGRLDNSLIVFTTDNGFMHGQHRSYFKISPYRASNEVDLIVRYPNDSITGAEDRIVTANVDVASTVLAWAGSDERRSGIPLNEDTKQRDGIPLVGIPKPMDHGVSEPAFCGWRTSTSLFVRYGSGDEEFYDYETDPHELTNRIDDPNYAKTIRASRRMARLNCTTPPPSFGASFDRPAGLFVTLVDGSEEPSTE